MIRDVVLGMGREGLYALRTVDDNVYGYFLVGSELDCDVTPEMLSALRMAEAIGKVEGSLAVGERVRAEREGETLTTRDGVALEGRVIEIRIFRL